MKIVIAGDWDEQEAEQYGGTCGVVLACGSREELARLLPPETRDSLFSEAEFEIVVKNKKED